MNKKEIIKAIATESQMSQKMAGSALEAFQNIVAASLINDEEVKIAGFGTFKAKNIDARTRRNPQNGEPIEVAAHKKVLFKPSAVLRNFLNS